ncbi:uncharacterized protein MONOS_11430 [Monocercomonoides exilis]|uniref:uncharacterized protein n=1 Tax=Monocercomonoides exilis TaxID=2049356 RepID=UPI0035598F81|nr:hypothetical protein MONOS_11430 [Monocercomonoides exilis]|eukprot:MONOS_11430.1-p1 / transcript=MONOS_11430.1 / gene=MONOS_11430 / organism=Monocercomonoides_exilis_PA203 / gene_product=unspecified product / transcript_product=unspecified product / location=Mono_scaffold00573:29047-29343(+) / protein_length=99 / sequence_SO=supercontig / SO=protein_coding / is_pseudo=false
MNIVTSMKALASEIVTDLCIWFFVLGMELREITGDAQLALPEISIFHLSVVTQVKLDTITRKEVNSLVAAMMTLLIIDEAFLLLKIEVPWSRRMWSAR